MPCVDFLLRLILLFKDMYVFFVRVGQCVFLHIENGKHNRLYSKDRGKLVLISTPLPAHSQNKVKNKSKKKRNESLYFFSNLQNREETKK